MNKPMVYQVRFFIDSTKTLTHSDAPYIGVTGCKFYDRDPSTNNNLREFDLIGENGCNNPPSSYNPFKAAAATTDGMYFNENPDGAGNLQINLNFACVDVVMYQISF